jgi:hypothetical protein
MNVFHSRAMIGDGCDSRAALSPRAGVGRHEWSAREEACDTFAADPVGYS